MKNLFLYFDSEILEQAEKAVKAGKLLDLKSDIVFKTFFANPSKEADYCRKRLLTAVLNRKVVKAKVLNPEIVPEFISGKAPRLDIHCTIDDGSEIDVEMQGRKYDDDQKKRSVYYAAKLMAGALKEGKKYMSVPEVHQIMFVNFRMADDDRLHHIYMFKENEDNSVLQKDFQIHFIELPKIKEILKKPLKSLSELEFWSILILAGADKHVQTMLRNFPDFKEDLDMAKVNLNKISKDKIAWAYKLSEEKFLYDWAAMQTDRREKDRALKKFEARVYALKSEVEAQKTEVESQKAEVEAQKTEVESQKAEVEARKTEVEAQKTEVESQKAEVEAQKTEVESQKAEVESQKTEIAAQKAELARREAELQKNADELKRKAAVLGITLD